MNLTAIKEHVSTQYGDLTGVIQIDGHDNISSIYNLCSDHGVDTEEIFIIGFGLEEHTTSGIGRRNEVSCSILYVLKAEYGNKFEEVESKIRNDGILRLKKRVVEIKYSDLSAYIKRYEFMVATNIASAAHEIEIEEDEMEK